MHLYDLFGRHAGFNRNIVECKDVYGDGYDPDGNSFNRNIVECKGSKRRTMRTAQSSFNRNIVECKGE